MDDRLRVLDLVDAPEQWEDIERRVPRPAMPPSQSPWRRTLTVVVALIVATAGVTFAVSTFHPGGRSTPTATVANGRIAFSGFDGKSWQIYSVEPDGTGLTQLTDVSNQQVAGEPAWSPDGKRIAYVVQGFHEDDRTDRSDIWVMDSDGSDPRQLTDGPGSSWSPAWSPDGTEIAFSKGDPSNLYVIGADGSGLRRVTTLTAAESASDPSWSPDGSRIVFSPSGEFEKDLYVVNTDGTDEALLLHMPRWQIQPAWSPDGRTILFTSSDPDGADFGIYTVGADGTNPLRLTAEPPAQSAAWSPDGRRIAFIGTAARLDHRALYVMNADGSDLHQVPDLAVEPTSPSWQPVVGDEGTTPSPFPTPTETPTPSPVSTAEIGHTIDVREASALMYADGSLWIDVLRDAATNTGTVLRIDPGSGEIQARIPVEAYPDSEHGGSGMVSDGRYLWIVGTRWSTDGVAGGILVRIDPDTETAETIDLPVGATGNDLVFDDGFLWTIGVSSPGKDPRVLQIDPATGAVVSETPIDAEWWGGLVVEGGAIWVMEMSVRNSTVQGDARLARLEPGAGTILARVPAVDENGVMGATDPVAGGGAIWVPTGSELLELDPETGEVLSRVNMAVGGDFEVAPDRSLWCLCGFGWNELERLSPDSGEVDVTVHLDRKPIPTAMAVTPGSVWVLTYDGTLIRVALS
jgi:hypothetical protein